MTAVEPKSGFKLKTDTHPRPHGHAMGVCCEELGEIVEG